jgi:hypothetical protein
MERSAPHGVEAIVTNPPYKNGAAFVAHALELGIPKVVMLLRVQFLESACRSSILDNGLLARVYVFSGRLPMMHRAGWEGKKNSSGFTFAWFVWEAGHRGPAELHRISYEKPPRARRKQRGRS